MNPKRCSASETHEVAGSRGQARILDFLTSLLLISAYGPWCFGQPGHVMKQVIPLNAGWEFRQSVGADAKPAEWRPATVPGDVHLDLLANKLIPEPFYRDNEAKLRWIENADWEYRNSIAITPEMLQHQHLDLVFKGLDAYSLVYVNDQQMLTANNMFREWRVDIKPYVKAGTNSLRVVFPTPIEAAAKVAAKDPWRERTRTEEKTYIRKAAYEYGWDWGPRFVTSGIWRLVNLELWDDARISDLYIHQKDITSEVAHVIAEVQVTASNAGVGTVAVDFLQAGKKATVTRSVTLDPGINHIDLAIDIQHPELWYPAGYGAQAMYAFHAELKVGKRVEDEVETRTGLRSIILRRDVDQWGRSFEFVVNGIPVFAKGADVIPFDSFPSRVTTAQYRRVLESAREANMNMIRHWGGGYYETQEFYDLCDELGIMIWQDFMFGNDWQPGTYDFKLEVEKEAEYQVTRLRNHPSIILWCGNNETEEAFHWDDRPMLPADVRMRMWQDYLTLFSGVLARTVARLNPETPFWPSSPSSDYEDLSPSYQSGDMHDWSVWHGHAEFTDYEKHFPRFMTEYGFQSFPEMRTIEAFTTGEDRDSIFTPVMLAHQKNNAGNSIIHDSMLRYYGEPKDFAFFLYASQVQQAEAIKIGAEHLRRLRPRTMGSIFWQLNDCWPVASWSSLDYFGRWKALHYYARRFYSPLLVSPHVEQGELAVYVVSDKTTEVPAQLRLRLMTLDGKVLREEKQAITVPALSSKVYIELPLEELLAQLDTADLFGAVDLTVGDERVSSNIVYFAPTKQVHLRAAGVDTQWSKTDGGYVLKLSSKVLARSVYVSFKDMDVTVSDNYFDLLPNEPAQIRILSSASQEQLQSALKIVSLSDAFVSQPGAHNPTTVPNGE